MLVMSIFVIGYYNEIIVMFPPSIGITSPISYWTECPIEKRSELFDDSKVWKTQWQGNNYFSSKRMKLTHCLQEAYRLKRVDVIDEIYTYLRNSKGLTEDEEHYPSILLWIDSTMKNGYLFDYYDIYCALAGYYRDTKQFEKAIEYNQIEFALHKDILSNLREVTGFDATRINLSHTNPCTMYIHNLIDICDFDKCRQVQEECLKAGFLDTGNEKKEQLIISYYWYRLEAEIEFHKKNGTVLQNLDDLHALESLGQYECASTGHKRIGDLYFKIKDYTSAVKHYKRALELWPEVYGAQSKLEKALKKIEPS